MATPTYDEIQAQIKKLQEQAETIRAAEIEGVLADVKAKIQKYGLTADLARGGVEHRLRARRVVDDLAVNEVAEGLGDGFVVLHGLPGQCAVSACLASAGSYE